MRFHLLVGLAIVFTAAVGAAQHEHSTQQQEQHRRLHREQDPTQQSFADVERFRALFESSERDGGGRNPSR